MSKEKNPKVKNVRVIHYLNYLIFLGILVFFSASCTKEEKGDEINKNQQTEGEETKRSSEAFNKNNKLWSTLDDPVKDGWATEKLADDAQLKLGHCNRSMGNYDKAREEYQRLIDYFPGSEFYDKARESIKQLNI